MIQIRVNGGSIAAYSVGHGPPLIFLHGGPGDTHHYMSRIAIPGDFQRIFFDQRGTGQSNSFARVAELFTIESLLSDLVAIQEYYNLKNPTLIGHSWGAMYALYACIRYPSIFRKAAFLNMGPLDSEAELATSHHLLSVLNESEKERWLSLRKKRNQALDDENVEKVEALDAELMKLRVNAWIYQAHLRTAYLNEYLQDPPCDREINKLIWNGIAQWFRWDKVNDLNTRALICVGANDSVPVSQAERLTTAMPNSDLAIFPECGHIPWFEYPDKFYDVLTRFLAER